MKTKFISLVTAVGLMVTASGCSFHFAINDTSHNQDTTVTSEHSKSAPTEQSTTAPLNINTDKIEVTEPNLEFGQSEINLLQSYGLDESYLRKQYTFDKNNLKSPDNKAYILDRMCNSTDYFTTLQATYTKKEHQKINLTSYAIDRRIKKAKELCYTVSEVDNECVPAAYVCVDGDYHLKMLFDGEIKDKNTFKYEPPLANNYKVINKTTKLIQQPFSDKLEAVTKKPQANSFNNNDENIGKYVDVTKNIFIANGYPEPYFRRFDDICLIYSQEHYNPQSFAMDVMIDFSNWKIDSVDTNNSGNEIISISGKYHDRYINVDNTFKLQIEKQTGVIVSEQIFNSSGNIIEEYNTLNIIVDGEIESDIFDSINP